MPEWMQAQVNILLMNTATICVAGLLFALLARRLGQSPLLGYLAAGLVIGPYGLRLVADEASIRFLAEVGVVLLMFALGAQLSLRQLLEERTTAVLGGGAQIIFTIVLGMGIGLVAGLPWPAALVLGFAVALSSSVVLVRLLGDYDDYHAAYGRVALAISIMQDLSAVVLISVLPFLQGETSAGVAALSVSLLKALLFVAWVIVLARWIAPGVLRWASSTGSREVLLPTVAVLSLGSAAASGALGFSYALGAFMAGIAISESVFSQALLSEVIPLRDIFGLLFFVSLGMLVNPAVVVSAWPLVVALLVATVIGKVLLIMGPVVLLRHHPYTAILAGIALSQVGEFSFIIAREAESRHEITAQLYSIILAVAILSIAFTPILLPAARGVYRRLRHAGYGGTPVPGMVDEETLPATPDGISVLVCGYGRVGRSIVQALDTFRVPFMVIDLDRRAVVALRRRGIRAVYGDAANVRLLTSVGAGCYRLGVIAVNDREAARTIAVHLRRLNPDMRLLVRSHSDQETILYLAMGISTVVQVELEASLSFVGEVLTAADVDGEIAVAYIDDIRTGYYEGLAPRKRPGNG